MTTSWIHHPSEPLGLSINFKMNMPRTNEPMKTVMQTSLKLRGTMATLNITRILTTLAPLIRRDKVVFDPRTNEPMKIVMWPRTKQLKEIPISQHFHEGYLDRMEFWAFDEVTATSAINFTDTDTILHLFGAKDLLRFRERDIHTLA
ncbi:unnamed protein product [Lactuca saligna]|uniref:Uncharacterized protein n=1 Tax=Lactuca saligna TaxID=75948 RepID=A0AA36DZM0_LACSI|nr:unnamed protein product [Lactuca saligna]